MKIGIDSTSPCFLPAINHLLQVSLFRILEGSVLPPRRRVCFASSEFPTTPRLCVESGVAPFLSVALPARPGGRTKVSCPTGQEAEPHMMDGQCRESSRMGKIRETKVYAPDTKAKASSTWCHSIFMINL